MDFGLAKLIEDEGGTVPQSAVTGTSGYMSPEQARGEALDQRSDLFSLGVVLYEMLGGRQTFSGGASVELTSGRRQEEPPGLPASVPQALGHIVCRCMEKEPDRRFQSAAELRSALESVSLSSPLPTSPEPVRDLEAAPQLGARTSARLLRKFGHRGWIATPVLVIGTLGGWGVSRFRQPPAEARSYRLQIDPPEGSRFTFGSTVGGLALSPDGRTAVYVAAGAVSSGLWVRPLDGAAARLIAGTERAAYPFWSPDSKSVAFFSGGKLRRVDLAGGAPLAICDVVVPRGGAWGSDGRILYGVAFGGLFQVPASGGTPAPLTTLDVSRGEGNHRWPQVLPGGRFLFSVQSGKPENTGIYAASLAKPGERVRLLATETNALYAPGGDGSSYLLWLRGGTLVAQQLNTGTLKLEGEPRSVADPVAKIGLLGHINVSVSAGGVVLYSASNPLSQFTWLDRTGKPVGVVGELGEYSTFRLSPDGLRVAAALDRLGSDNLWLLEVDRGVAGRFTINSGQFPVWSPDGRTIVYGTGSPLNLFRKESSGAGEAQRLSQLPYIQNATDWSRDGRWLLYYELTPGTQRDLWALPVTPEGKPARGTTPKPYLRTPSNESYGRFSPEAPPRWVAYQSDDTGQWEVYIQSFPEPRGATRISTGGGQYPQWGAGTRELFYVSPDNKLMVVSLKLGAAAVEPSTPRELFPLPTVETGWSPYETTQDGQRFLVRATPRQGAQPLNVIVNWPALLKREAPAP